MSTKTKYNWFRLDNAGKVFPDASNKRRTNVFRISCNLTEEVEPEILQQAVNELKPRFPTFYVKLKKGLFWYYYETNEYNLAVKEEPSHMCCIPTENDNYLFNVFYYKKRITVEVFHSLTDGSGCCEYLKSLVFHYLQLIEKDISHDGMIIIKDTVNKIENEDSFVKNYSGNDCIKRDADKAYKVKGTKFAETMGLGLITGKFKFEELRAIAKEKNVTVTTFIAGLLLHSIIETDFKHLPTSKNRLKIMIPVNMRKYFPSKTLRNFSLMVYAKLKMDGYTYTLDEILEIIKDDIQKQLKHENMQKLLNTNVKIEKSKFIKIVPLFLKQIVMKLGQKKYGDRVQSLVLSNLGNIELPPSMQAYVESMEWVLYVERKSSHNMTVCSNNGIMNISFSRTIYESELERVFFKSLASMGVGITIESNLWEENA